VTPVFVEVEEGALTTFVNPASLAADTGTSTLVDGFDAEDVAAATGTTTMDPTTATTVATMLAATARFKVSFLTITRLSEGGKLQSPIGLEAIQFGCRLASVRKIADLGAIDAAPEAFV
jgi:hypothetical protein